MENILTRIETLFPTLTKKQRLVASIMIDQPENMTFCTLKELAMAAGVSEMTVLNTCTALGFTNYNEIKYEFRRFLSLQAKMAAQEQDAYRTTNLPSYEQDSPEALLGQIAEEERNNCLSLFSQLNMKELLAQGQRMIDSRFTAFVGRGVSLHLAHFMSMRLALMGLPSVVVDSEDFDSIHSSLPLLAQDTLLVAVSLPDYYFMTTKILEFAKKSGIPTLGLTDSTKSPIVQYCDGVLTAPSATRLFINTLGPMFALANLLTTGVNLLMSRSAHKGPDTIEAFRSLFEE